MILCIEIKKDRDVEKGSVKVDAILGAFMGTGVRSFIKGDGWFHPVISRRFFFIIVDVYSGSVISEERRPWS
jgi:hypothetical protein